MESNEENIPGTTLQKIRMIGAKIKQLRIDAGYKSVEFFARKFHLARIQYWRMEKGANCTLKSLLKVLNVYKMSLRNFFKDID